MPRSYASNAMKYMDKGQKLEMSRKYPHTVELPRHPDHPSRQKNGDPRKQWLYGGVASGKWFAESSQDYFGFDLNSVIYRFSNESDALIFRLKWGFGAV